ncbi:MAG: 4-alpha-glucanotransferase [Treponema sp.]|jgi:4-alpha-glucanotransferase|nr:4-alpha-glucanotransferase [Treponema sp.]
MSGIEQPANPLYETKPRRAGVLFHVASLPGPFGIGDMGKEARAFADFLAETGCALWQILPLGPTGFGNSPYAARSSFAGNELLVSPELLAEEGWLEKRDLEELKAAFAPVRDTPPRRAGGNFSERVDYGLVEEKKLPLLRKAAAAFLDRPDSAGAEYAAFCEKERFWLSDYALFQVLCGIYRDARWHTVWDAPAAARDEAALEKIRAEKKDEIEQWKVLQWFFKRQWEDLKSHVNRGGLRIVGDIPIFVAPDSVDSWSHIDLFRTENGGYSVVSGVPPDYFSPTGQLWGNPVYDWDKMKERGYVWWIARIKKLLEQVDIFRIDHFRGFDEYWAVPAGNPTAEYGNWEPGPGSDFFDALRTALGELPVIAEDLGFMTDGVRRLRDGQGFPGMKVCQFGFEDIKDGVLDARHLFLPHNYGYNWAAYTGTHDNDTTAGWYEKLSAADRRTVAEYFNAAGLPSGADIAWAMIRAVSASHARYAIFPLQDILGLGSEARINIPATCGSHNWSWRLGGPVREILDADIARRFRRLNELYGRIGPS